MAIGFKPKNEKPKKRKLPAERSEPIDKISRKISEISANPKKRETKGIVTMRVDADILEFFKDTGPMWQTRINQILRRAMEHAKGRVE